MLERDHQDDDTIIAIMWSKEDFPRVWDRLYAAYTHQWDSDLLNATADRLTERTSHMGFYLPDENKEGEDDFWERED